MNAVALSFPSLRRDAQGSPRPASSHQSTRTDQWPLPPWPLPRDAHHNFEDIALMPMTAYADFGDASRSSHERRSSDDASSTHQLVIRPESPMEPRTNVVHFQSPPRSPSPGPQIITPPRAPSPEVPYAYPIFDRRDAYLTMGLGAACGTVCGVFIGPMVGSLWGAETEAQSLQLTAPAGLVLGFIIGCIIAGVKLKRGARSLSAPPV